jgi:hypothetical protein
MKKETFINEKQRIYLELFSLWIKNKMSTLSGGTMIQVIGKDYSLMEYYSLINDIIVKDYYDRNERDILNELRLRYMYNSLDYHLAMSI